MFQSNLALQVVSLFCLFVCSCVFIATFIPKLGAIEEMGHEVTGMVRIIFLIAIVGFLRGAF